MVPQSWYLLLSAALFTLGVAGFAARRNSLVMFMSVELMLNAANVAFVACARAHEPLVRGNAKGRNVDGEAQDELVGLAVV